MEIPTLLPYIIGSSNFLRLFKSHMTTGTVQPEHDFIGAYFDETETDNYIKIL